MSVNKKKQNTKLISTMPICLLMAKKNALVIGGGKVAEHKVNVLMEAGAKVKVIAPEITEELIKLKKVGRIDVLNRAFNPADLEDANLVFAATDDEELNRKIIALAKEKKVLCCSVDGNWREGDFLTPAIVRKSGLTIAISTSGMSCRRSRIMREYMERHISLLDNSDICVIGTDHTLSGISEREIVEPSPQNIMFLRKIWGIHEFMILKTCNRIEFLGLISPQEDILDFIKKAISLDIIKKENIYIKKSFSAFEHTALLASGLLSQAKGEYHIVSQMKASLKEALANNWAGATISDWMAHALHISKEIRNLFKGKIVSLELEDIAINAIENRFRKANRKVIVIGTGMIGTSIVKKLNKRKEDEIIWIYHTNKPEPVDKMLQVFKVVNLKDINQVLPEADCIISAVSTENAKHIVTKEHSKALNLGKPILFIDLSIPRSIDPTIKSISKNLMLIDIEDLKHIKNENEKHIKPILNEAHQVISEHKELYEHLAKSFKGWHT